MSGECCVPGTEKRGRQTVSAVSGEGIRVEETWQSEDGGKEL